MSKYIVDATTGTVLAADDCYVLDAENFPEQELSDSEIGELARTLGKSILKIGQDTGWGDNAYRYSVSYSPLSIKDEAEMLLDGGVYEYDEPQKTALMWVGTATDDQLEQIAQTVMWDDYVWNGYKDNVMDAIMTVYKENNGE